MEQCIAMHNNTPPAYAHKLRFHFALESHASPFQDVETGRWAGTGGVVLDQRLHCRTECPSRYVVPFNHARAGQGWAE